MLNFYKGISGIIIVKSPLLLAGVLWKELFLFVLEGYLDNHHFTRRHEHLKAKILPLNFGMKGQLFFDAFKLGEHCCLSQVLFKLNFFWGQMPDTLWNMVARVYSNLWRVRETWC